MDFWFAYSLPIHQMKFFPVVWFSSLPHKSSNFSCKVFHNFFGGKRDRAGVDGICREDGIDKSELSSRTKPPCPPRVDFVLDLIYHPLPVSCPFFPFEDWHPKVIEGIPSCISFETKGPCYLFQCSRGAILAINLGLGWIYFSISFFEEGVQDSIESLCNCVRCTSK